MQGHRTTTVHVSKAQDIPIADGESLHGFIRRINDAVRQHLTKKLGLTKNFSIFLPDIFRDRVVADVMKFAGDHGEARTRKLMSMTFQANAGGFDFGEPVEVQQRVQYVPVAKRAPSFWDR